MITVAKSSSLRNHRNNPYLLDQLFVRVHRSAAGTLFRFRTELATLIAAMTGGWELARAVTLTWAVAICFETRMHTRSGRLPLVLRIHPTQVGERALVWCRAGICAADFEAHTGELAAACYARQARVEGSKRWAQLVNVDIVRRDTLAPHQVIPSGLADGRWGERRKPAA